MNLAMDRITSLACSFEIGAAVHASLQRGTIQQKLSFDPAICNTHMVGCDLIRSFICINSVKALFVWWIVVQQSDILNTSYVLILRQSTYQLVEQIYQSAAHFSVCH
ncbi:hypothetical protein CsSME_00004628 [Camellia sinensis var. sinensis]